MLVLLFRTLCLGFVFCFAPLCSSATPPIVRSTDDIKNQIHNDWLFLENHLRHANHRLYDHDPITEDEIRQLQQKNAETIEAYYRQHPEQWLSLIGIMAKLSRFFIALRVPPRIKLFYALPFMQRLRNGRAVPEMHYFPFRSPLLLIDKFLGKEIRNKPLQNSSVLSGYFSTILSSAALQSINGAQYVDGWINVSSSVVGQHAFTLDRILYFLEFYREYTETPMDASEYALSEFIFHKSDLALAQFIRLNLEAGELSQLVGNNELYQELKGSWSQKPHLLPETIQKEFSHATRLPLVIEVLKKLSVRKCNDILSSR